MCCEQPLFAADSFGYFNPAAVTFYPLTNGYAYSALEPIGDEGWVSEVTSVQSTNLTSTTFVFICNASATTVALTAATAKVLADPTQSQYIVQLQTSLACQSSNLFLPKPASSTGFGGLGYDLTSLTGYDIFAQQTGSYVGSYTSYTTLSFCVSIFNGGASSWTYSLRGVLTAVFALSSGTPSNNPQGTFTATALQSGVVSSSNGDADVPLVLAPLSTDGSDNVLTIRAGSPSVNASGGGISFTWTTPGGAAVLANLFLNNGKLLVDTTSAIWVGSPTFTMTVAYYNASAPSLIACNTASQPIAVASAAPNVLNVPAYYYFINLGGQVQDPTCQLYAPGSMVCQRWTANPIANQCSRTEVAAVYQPSVSTPVWTYINGANYTGGIQLSLTTAAPLAMTHTGASQLACAGTFVRIQFVCSATALRPINVAALSLAVSENAACSFTFLIPTYLLCSAPGALPVPTPEGGSIPSCGATLNGVTYNLSPLSVVDLSAYAGNATNSTQYVVRPCGTVANAFCQQTIATYQSSFCAIPTVCTNAPQNTLPITNVAGPYSASTASWAVIPGGIRVVQSTGQSCSASCGGQTVYNGPTQSIINFICAPGSSGLAFNNSVSLGSYNPTTCAAINGGSCTVTFTTYTTYACAAPTDRIGFNAITTNAPWEARANMGFSVTVAPVSYTAVGATAATSLPAGSFIVYGGQNELPGNPNNGSGTFVVPLTDAWASTDGVTWALVGGTTLQYGNLGAGQFSSVPGQVATTATATAQGLPTFTEAQNSMKCTDRVTGRMYLFNGAVFQPATHNFGAPRTLSYSSVDGQTWVNMTDGFVPPPRVYGRCIVDSSSRVYIFGSRENAAETESNDVWQLVYNAATNQQTWTQQTANAPWTPRDSPGADTYFSAVLGVEIMTLAGGYNLQAAFGGTNDVWVSSDLGKSWYQASANAPWQVRDHASLIASPAGVLVSTSGGFGVYQANDIWVYVAHHNAAPHSRPPRPQCTAHLLLTPLALCLLRRSLDGGVTWGNCNGPAVDPNAAQAFPGRKDTTTFFDAAGYMYVSAGLNQYSGAGFSTGTVYQAYNDWWKSTISFNNIAQVASACGLKQPTCGIGLGCFPPSANCTCGAGRTTTGLASASLCFLEYSLPGNVDYPWSEKQPLPRHTHPCYCSR